MKLFFFWPSVYVALALIACYWLGRVEDAGKRESFQEKEPPPFTQIQADFVKQIHRVDDGAYVAVGYGLANSILLEGEDGFIVVDTLESVEVARSVLAALTQVVPRKQILAVIYTHFHSDHTGGAAAFLHNNSFVIPNVTFPKIIAHRTLLTEMNEFLGRTNEANYRRSMRQFGALAPQREHINCGIGPKLALGQGQSVGFVPPNVWVDEVLEMRLGGLSVSLLHMPGETNDQIVVWLPEKRILCAADNIYKAFPNVYAIRGTKTRDPEKWIQSLTRMMNLGAEHLIPSHGVPVSGREAVRELLGTYRDGLRYVHDQTVRLINQGKTPQEITEILQLPPKLRDHPYLQENYGRIPWTIHAICNHYMGYFSGDAVDLNPASSLSQARFVERLVGGRDKLAQWISYLAESDRAEDCQFALQLVRAMQQLCSRSVAAAQDCGAMRQTEIKLLTCLAQHERSAGGYNYYRTAAQELLRDPQMLAIQRNEYKSMVMDPDFNVTLMFTALASRLDPAKAADVNRHVVFELTEHGKARLFIHLHVVNSVCHVEQFDFYSPSEEALFVNMTVACWKGLTMAPAPVRYLVQAWRGKDLSFGDEADSWVSFGQFLTFMYMFDPMVLRTS